MMNLKENMKYFFKGDKRTVLAKKNIIGSFFAKGFSSLISFILVPLTLEYLSPVEYGVWLTLSSLLFWLTLTDVGLGDGLKNRLAEAFAKNDTYHAKVYISTCFYIFSIILLVICLCFLLIQPFIDWNAVLNIDQSLVNNLNEIIVIVFLFFCASLVFKMIGNVYMAKQLPVFNDLINFGGQFLALIIIYYLVKCTESSLFNIAVTYTLSPLIVLLIAFYITFFVKYKNLRPSISFIKIKYLRDLMGLGVQFFVIQICTIILLSTSNIIISQVLGPSDVTSYNIAYKYFAIIFIVFSVIVSPLWSATTDAYVKQDITWIKIYMRKMLRVWLLSLVFSALMLIFSPIIYKFWVGEDIQISIVLSALCCIHITLLNWTNIWGAFLKGVGKIRLQLYYSVVSSLLFIPLAIFLGKTFGLNGIASAMCIVLIPGAICAPVQYFKLIKGKAFGLWNK